MIHMNLAKMQLLPLMSLFVLMWTGQTFADDPKVKSVNVYDGVVLSCSFGNIDMTNEQFDWKKKDANEKVEEVYFYNGGTVTVDPNFKGRVTHFSEPLKSGNVSINISSARVTDSGTYICKHPKHTPEIRGTIQLKVDCILKDRTPENIPDTCPMPTLTTLSKSINSVTVECKAVGAVSQPEIELQDKNNNPVPANKRTYFENGTIIFIAEVTKEDHYSCVVRQQNICHEIRSKPTLLVVPDASGVLQLSSGLLLLPLLGLLKELFSAWP